MILPCWPCGDPPYPEDSGTSDIGVFYQDFGKSLEILGETVMRKGSDWLRQQSTNKKRESGISVLDLAKLPPNQRKIMRVLLRKVEMAYSELCEAVEAMPEADRMDQSELDEALKTLCERDWLVRIGGQHIIYKASFRRKAASSLPKNIWSALEPKSKQNNEP